MVAYRSIPGTRVGVITFPDKENKKPRVPCARCGVVREATTSVERRKTSTGLCKDCYFTITPEERKLWRNDQQGRADQVPGEAGGGSTGD